MVADMTGWIVAGLLVGTGGLVAGLQIRRRRRRKRLMRGPFPKAWDAILDQNLPMVARLPADLRHQLLGYMNVFLDEKNFEGCGGQEITEEVRVTIAAQACLLLVGRESRVYPRLKSVLVYPHTYVAGGKGIFGGKYEETSARLGESWQTGAVILSWHSVLGGAVNVEDGHNVTLHEFAHQLDQEDGAADGAPKLEHASSYRSWARCFQREYKEFLGQLDQGKKTVIDAYGATNAAEFFSTATEAFFEKPRQLREKRPELYEELRGYYGVDPESW